MLELIKSLKIDVNKKNLSSVFCDTLFQLVFWLYIEL